MSEQTTLDETTQTDDEDEKCLCEIDPDGTGCFKHYACRGEDQ